MVVGNPVHLDVVLHKTGSNATCVCESEGTSDWTRIQPLKNNYASRKPFRQVLLQFIHEPEARDGHDGSVTHHG